jgi:hypothetical protein
MCSCFSVPAGVADGWVRDTVREQRFGGDKVTSQVVYRCHRWLENGANAQPAHLNTLQRRKAGLVGGSVVNGRRRIKCVELESHRNDSTIRISSGNHGEKEGILHTKVVTRVGPILGSPSIDASATEGTEPSSMLCALAWNQVSTAGNVRRRIEGTCSRRLYPKARIQRRASYQPGALYNLDRS